MEIDEDLLSDLLGVPVIATAATKRIGLDALRPAIEDARPGHADPELLKLLSGMLRQVGDAREAVLVLEGDDIVAKRHGVPPGEMRESIYRRRRDRVNDIVGHVVRETSIGKRLSVRFAQMTLSPWTGIPILALVLFLMYQLIGVVVAQKLVGFTEGVLMRDHVEPAIRAFIFSWIPAHSAAGAVLAGRFGVLTMTITYLFGLLLPLVLGFYLALSVLEDSGYLPRLAALTDRVLNGIGLNGRAVIPIILGFGCITMATVTTRLLGTKREKTIATSVLNFALPCSAQLGVMLGMLAYLTPAAVLVWGAVVLGVLFAVGWLAARVLPGKRSDFILELPPIRWPQLGNIVIKTLARLEWYLKEVLPLFVLGTFVLFTLDRTGALGVLELWAAPLVQGGKDVWPFDQELNMLLENAYNTHPTFWVDIFGGKIKFTDPDIVKEAQKLAIMDPKKGYYAEGSLSTTYDQAWQVMLQKKAAMWFMGSWRPK
jgi:ferrous iron transport protein B